MRELQFTLLPDGSSDRALISILTWLLREYCGGCPIQARLVDLRRLRKPPTKLSERIRWSLELYPCDLLFVHRDAEREPLQKRVDEICEALAEVQEAQSVPTVCIVPVRMQEAWLLIDEVALRKAAGNPSGRQSLDLPAIKNLEELPDPKEVLHDLLRRASGLRGRRLKRFFVRKNAQRLAVLIEDYGPLRRLSAFRKLEAEVKRAVEEQGWAQ